MTVCTTLYTFPVFSNQKWQLSGFLSLSLWVVRVCVTGCGCAGGRVIMMCACVRAWVRACLLTRARACVRACMCVVRTTFADGLMAAKQCNLKLPLIAKIMSRFCTSTDSVCTGLQAMTNLGEVNCKVHETRCRCTCDPVWDFKAFKALEQCSQESHYKWDIITSCCPLFFFF